MQEYNNSIAGSKLFAYWVILHIFCRLLIFSKLTFSRKNSGTLSEYQVVWIQIRTDILSVLIWVQTVCKGYQQTTLAGKELHNGSRSALKVQSNVFEGVMQHTILLDTLKKIVTVIKSCDIQSLIAIHSRLIVIHS